jgi:hypothetical protein
MTRIPAIKPDKLISGSNATHPGELRFFWKMFKAILIDQAGQVIYP